MARRWQVLIVTSAAVFMALLDVTIVNIAFSDLRASFPRDSLADLSWVFNAYNVVFAAVLVPAGRLADRIGRKRLFLVGATLFLAASVLCGLAPVVWVLISARALQAVGGALLMPTSLSLILPEFPPEQRATATALWTMTGAVAAAIGPSLGGLLVDWQGWRWVFFVNLAIGLPALARAVGLLKESRDEHPTGWPDALGTIALMAGVGALALAIVKGQDWGWGSGRELGSLALAAVLLALVVFRSIRHATPAVDLSLFRVRSFSVAGMGTLVFGMGFYSLLLNNVMFLTTAWGYSVLGAGVALTPGALMAAISSPVAGRLADRFGSKAIAIPGNILFACGSLVLLLNTGVEQHYWSAFFPGMVLGGMGIGFSLPAFTSAAVAELPRPKFATGIGLMAFLRQLGAVLGIAVLVAVTEAAGPGMTGFHRVWTIIACCGLAATLMSISLGRTRRTPKTDPVPEPAAL